MCSVHFKDFVSFALKSVVDHSRPSPWQHTLWRVRNQALFNINVSRNFFQNYNFIILLFYWHGKAWKKPSIVHLTFGFVLQLDFFFHNRRYSLLCETRKFLTKIPSLHFYLLHFSYSCPRDTSGEITWIIRLTLRIKTKRDSQECCTSSVARGSSAGDREWCRDYPTGTYSRNSQGAGNPVSCTRLDRMSEVKCLITGPCTNHFISCKNCKMKWTKEKLFTVSVCSI